MIHFNITSVNNFITFILNVKGNVNVWRHNHQTNFQRTQMLHNDFLATNLNWQYKLTKTRDSARASALKDLFLNKIPTLFLSRWIVFTPKVQRCNDAHFQRGDLFSDCQPVPQIFAKMHFKQPSIRFNRENRPCQLRKRLNPGLCAPALSVIKLCQHYFFSHVAILSKFFEVIPPRVL